MFCWACRERPDKVFLRKTWKCHVLLKDLNKWCEVLLQNSIMHKLHGEDVMSEYIDLKDVKKVLESRQELCKDVEELWKSVGLKFPTQFQGCGVLGRDPMTRVEFFKFWEMCDDSEIRPACITGNDELFVSSKVKVSMAHPMMFEGFSKKGFPILQKEKLIDINKHDGQSTLEETGILEFHRARIERVCPNLLIWDMSEAMKCWRNLGLYYQGYLSICLAHGVLFEDYHGVGESGKCLSDFTERVFEPAFEWLKNKFGVGPIIVPLPWKDSYKLHPNNNILQQMNKDDKGIDFEPIKILL